MILPKNDRLYIVKRVRTLINDSDELSGSLPVDEADAWKASNADFMRFVLTIFDVKEEESQPDEKGFTTNESQLPVVYPKELDRPTLDFITQCWETHQVIDKPSILLLINHARITIPAEYKPRRG